jgi:hypothetical protein
MNTKYCAMYPGRITAFSERALDWLGREQITSVKEASQIAKALCLWGQDARKAIEWLQHTRLADHWESGNPVRDTARACAALVECGIYCEGTVNWLEEIQSDHGSWKDDVYDTCYALIALGIMGRQNLPGVDWLLKNFSGKWMHPGTIALINSALIQQDAKGMAENIRRNSSWLLEQCKDDNWKYMATSCLVVQSLVLDGRSGDVSGSLDWLVESLEESEWKVSVVALVLITLKMYLNELDGRGL